MGEKVKSHSRRIMFSKQIYAAEAVKLAAYVFSDKADIKLASSAGGVEAEVSWEGKDCAVAGEFANEVLNQQCRLDLAVKNGKVANMIVTKALLSASGETVKKRGKQ
ncbi:MAG TPA: hypothetical protein DCL44_04865 [Elusimicrobia bacterium]|nr:hypothetical protein [Elusimicrobiota bacterium]